MLNTKLEELHELLLYNTREDIIPSDQLHEFLLYNTSEDVLAVM